MAFVRDVEVHVEGGHMDRIKVQPSETQVQGLVLRMLVCGMCTYAMHALYICAATVHVVYTILS